MFWGWAQTVWRRWGAGDLIGDGDRQGVELGVFELKQVCQWPVRDLHHYKQGLLAAKPRQNTPLSHSDKHWKLPPRKAWLTEVPCASHTYHHTFPLFFNITILNKTIWPSMALKYQIQAHKQCLIQPQYYRLPLLTKYLISHHISHLFWPMIYD